MADQAVSPPDYNTKTPGTGWLYSKDGKALLVSEQRQYDELWDQGWRASPAAFGVETHPSNPAMQMVAGAGAIGASNVVAGDLGGFADLQRRVAALEQEMATLHVTHEGFEGRMTSMESRGPAPTIAPPPETSLSRGRQMEEEAKQREAEGKAAEVASAHSVEAKPSPQAMEGSPSGSTEHGRPGRQGR
jgi:hypothetical protein